MSNRLTTTETYMAVVIRKAEYELTEAQLAAYESIDDPVEQSAWLAIMGLPHTTTETVEVGDLDTCDAVVVRERESSFYRGTTVYVDDEDDAVYRLTPKGKLTASLISNLNISYEEATVIASDVFPNDGEVVGS